MELHGSYSIERLSSMQKDCGSTSAWRVFVVLATTPLLSLVCVAVIDALPMNSPDLGLAQSGTVWARGILVGLLQSFSLSLMFSLYVSDLRLSIITLLFTALAATVVSHTVVFCLIMLLWYPLPCTLLWMCGPWIGTLALSLKVARGHFLREHAEVQREVRRFSSILLMQTATAVVYPAFDIIFHVVPGEWHTVAALLVPVFKISERNLFCRLLRGKDDLMPEMVIFSVEITNALFISTSMQQASSINTSGLLILIDFVQMLVSLFDLSLMLKSAKEITDKMGISTNEVIASAVMIASKYPELGQQTLLTECLSPSKSDVFRLSTLQRIRMSKNAVQVGRKSTSKTQVAPTPTNIGMGVVPIPSWVLPVERNSVGPTPDDMVIECITPRERQLLLRKALQILFLTEFLLLKEFMEVVTPVMYGKTKR